MTKNNVAIEAMELNEEIHKQNGIKIQGGKIYTKVVHRVEAFRRTVGYEYGIDTQVTLGNSGAMVKAVITNPDGKIIGAGTAFVASISKDKSIEKTESTAIGRALASLGLGGDEYAAIEDIQTHDERYQKSDAAPTQEELKAQPKAENSPKEREVIDLCAAIKADIQKQRALNALEKLWEVKFKDLDEVMSYSEKYHSALVNVYNDKRVELENAEMDGSHE